MGRTKRCPGCNLPQAEHALGRLGKKCSGPVQDEFPELSDEDDNAREEEDASPHDSSIQATLQSLLGAVQTLTTGLDEVKADNKNLRALIEKKKVADGTSVSPPTPFDGDDVAQVSNRPVSAVTLPELRAMAHLSQKADRHVVQLGLAASSASSSDSDDQDGEIQSPLRKTDKRSRAHPGKSLKSGKEAKITSTVMATLLSQHYSRSPRRQIRRAYTS